jgi:4-hydroxybenzoate polyprenyltransferase
MHFFNKLKYNTHQFLLLARVTSPTGFLLLFFPCAFTSAIYSHNLNELCSILFLTAICSFIIRSAGCVINDIIDRSVDIKVARTKKRPLAAGTLKLRSALIFLGSLLFIQLYILMYLPIRSIIAAFTIFPLIIIYPTLKRITYLPQVFLGIVFNFGVIITYYMISSKLQLSAFMLYLGCIFWTIAYDTIYGFMDWQDDAKNNIKSFSLLIKNYHPKIILGMCYFLFIFFSMLAMYIATNNIGYISCIFFLVSFITLIRQLTFDINNPQSCMMNFKANNLSGLWIFCAFVSNNDNLNYIRSLDAVVLLIKHV